MEELIEAMDHNFEGYDAIYRMVHDKSPKYGNDDDYADDLMQDVFYLYHDLITGRPNMKGGKYGVDMLPTTSVKLSEQQLMDVKLTYLYPKVFLLKNLQIRMVLQLLSNPALR